MGTLFRCLVSGWRLLKSTLVECIGRSQLHGAMPVCRYESWSAPLPMLPERVHCELSTINIWSAWNAEMSRSYIVTSPALPNRLVTLSSGSSGSVLQCISDISGLHVQISRQTTKLYRSASRWTFLCLYHGMGSRVLPRDR